MIDKTLVLTVSSAIALLIVTLLLYPHFKNQSRGQFAEWHVINTNVGGGYGDANLIVIGDEVVMIDVGQFSRKPTRTVKYLQQFEIDTIDHLFLSHPHSSFYGGIVPILQAGIRIKNIYAQAEPIAAMTNWQHQLELTQTLEFAVSKSATIIEVQKGFDLSLPQGGRLEVVHAWSPGQPVDSNSVDTTSMFLKFSIGESSVLFVGDIDGDTQNLPDSILTLKAEILKLPHTAESDQLSIEYFDNVRPQYLIAPSPKRRWCTEIGEEVRQWTIDRQLPTWVTGSNGNIRVVWKPSQLLIAPQFADGRCKLKKFGNVVVNR